MRPPSVSYSVVITYHFPIEHLKKNNNILYSSQREIKAVVRSYTLTYNEELNCTYLNNSKSHDQLLFEYFSLSCNITTSFCLNSMVDASHFHIEYHTARSCSEFNVANFSLSYRTSCDEVMLNVLRCQLGTSCDQCRSMVKYSFTSTETRRLVRTDSPGRPPRLSHSS